MGASAAVTPYKAKLASSKFAAWRERTWIEYMNATNARRLSQEGTT